MPPHGIDLASFATISADMAEGDRPAGDLLKDRDLTDAQWTEVTLYWSERMTTDARDAALAGALPRVALDFSEAFAKAQDAKRPLPALDVRGWFLLQRDADAIGVAKALAARGLGLPDYSRLVRHWARAIATDRAIANQLSQMDRMAAFEEAVKGV